LPDALAAIFPPESMAVFHSTSCARMDAMRATLM
jgi:hypothetical protein